MDVERSINVSDPLLTINPRLRPYTRPYTAYAGRATHQEKFGNGDGGYWHRASGDHRGGGAVGAGGVGLPGAARGGEPGPRARRLRGLALAEARLRPPPPSPPQADQRAPPCAARRRRPGLPPPRPLRPLPRRLRRPLRRARAPPPRGPCRALRGRAVGGGGRRPRHRRGGAARREVLGGGHGGVRREGAAGGARAGHVHRRGHALQGLRIRRGDAWESGARRRVRQLGDGDRPGPCRRRRRRLHRRPRRAPPDDEGDHERVHGAVRVPARLDDRQAGAARVLPRVRRHRQARPPTARSRALRQKAADQRLPCHRRRHLQQDQERPDPGAAGDDEHRRGRGGVCRRQTAALRRHRPRHRVPQHGKEVAQERRRRADRRQRDGGREIAQGGEWALSRGASGERDLRQLHGRSVYRRGHQHAAAGLRRVRQRQRQCGLESSSHPHVYGLSCMRACAQWPATIVHGPAREQCSVPGRSHDLACFGLLPNHTLLKKNWSWLKDWFLFGWLPTFWLVNASLPTLVYFFS